MFAYDLGKYQDTTKLFYYKREIISLDGNCMDSPLNCENSKTDFNALVRSQEDGKSLDRDFKKSSNIYERDIKLYRNSSWIWVGHESQIQKVRGYLLFHGDTESLIIV